MPLVSVEPAERRADPAASAPSSTWPRRRRLVFAALLLIAAGSACAGDTVTDRPAAASSEPRSFALYALSRGKGVPQRARAVLARAQSVLEDLQARGADITVTEERIGLEGETRLCATFADGSLAEEVLEQLRRLVSGVDLVNLAEEPCGAKGRP
ncbi:MAG: hypothetical protein ACREH3_01735 [Geminicoccales bacterium]